MKKIKFNFLFGLVYFMLLIWDACTMWMANSYNITPSNFDKDDRYLFVDDPEIWIKVLGDSAWTSFKPFGYAEIDKSLKATNEYAEFKAGIPARVIAKKVVESKQTFECKIKQFQPETLALLQCGVIESGTGEKYVHIGSEPPAALQLAIIVKGKTFGDLNLELRLRKVQPSMESVDILLGAKEFASMDFKGDVLVDDDPLANNFDWRTYGEVETTAAITSADDDITVASATGLSVGMYAYGTGIPEDTTILAIDGTTVTLSANATATGTGVAVKFNTAENLAKTDVAYWICEEPAA